MHLRKLKKKKRKNNNIFFKTKIYFWNGFKVKKFEKSINVVFDVVLTKV